MKKLSFAVLFAMVAMSKIYGYEGLAGTMNGEKIWRSSDIVTNHVNLFIATGNIMIGHVFISSPGINSNIVFQEANSNTAGFDSPTFFGSSVPFDGGKSDKGLSTDKNTLGDRWIYVMSRSTWGWAVTTSGATPARLRIFWDYLESPRR